MACASEGRRQRDEVLRALLPRFTVRCLADCARDVCHLRPGRVRREELELEIVQRCGDAIVRRGVCNFFLRQWSVRDIQVWIASLKARGILPRTVRLPAGKRDHLVDGVLQLMDLGGSPQNSSPPVCSSLAIVPYEPTACSSNEPAACSSNETNEGIMVASASRADPVRLRRKLHSGW